VVQAIRSRHFKSIENPIMYSVLLEFSTIVSGRFVHQIRAYIKQAQQTKTLSMRAVPADRSANEHESGREVA